MAKLMITKYFKDPKAEDLFQARVLNRNSIVLPIVKIASPIIRQLNISINRKMVSKGGKFQDKMQKIHKHLKSKITYRIKLGNSIQISLYLVAIIVVTDLSR